MLLATACSHPPACMIGSGGSCTVQALTGQPGSFCRDDSASSPADAQRACNGLGGTYSTSPCPAANRVGRCTYTPTYNGQFTDGCYVNSYYEPWPASAAANDCASSNENPNSMLNAVVTSWQNN
jgi:hypothetical protein